jgi:hypothetical protein
MVSNKEIYFPLFYHFYFFPCHYASRCSKVVTGKYRDIATLHGGAWQAVHAGASWAWGIMTSGTEIKYWHHPKTA